MGARVAVAGASGYAGGELLRLLAARPDLELAAVTADSSAGKTVGDVHPHLAGAPALAGLTLQPHEPDLLGATDLVFLALPAGQSAVTAAQIPGTTKVVDLGPDFRLADGAAWARHYSGPHPGRWVTGIPELRRRQDADPGVQPGGRSRLLRDGGDPRAGAARRCRARRPGRRRDRRRVRHVRGRAFAPR